MYFINWHGIHRRVGDRGSESIVLLSRGLASGSMEKCIRYDTDRPLELYGLETSLLMECSPWVHVPDLPAYVKAIGAR